MSILEDWRHIKKDKIESILTGQAEDWLEEWFNYHLKEDGHYCKLCNKRVEEVISNYNIRFHNDNKERLWTESEEGGNFLLDLARDLRATEEVEKRLNEIQSILKSRAAGRYLVLQEVIK